MPSHNPLGDLFAAFDAECFQRCFAAWMTSFTGLLEGVVALDGKISRRSRRKATLHALSAFAARQRLVLGQTKVTRYQSVEGDHGRIETRTTTVIHDVDWVQQHHAWPGLKSLVMVESIRELGEKIEQETRYYLSSLT